MFQGKYLKGRSVLESETKGNISAAWKDIKYGAKLLIDNIRWIVGNGQDIYFWMSDWSRLGPFIQWATVSITHNQLNVKVSQFVNENGWDMTKVKDLLPMDIILKILAIYIAQDDSRKDAMSWRGIK